MIPTIWDVYNIIILAKLSSWQIIFFKGSIKMINRPIKEATKGGLKND